MLDIEFEINSVNFIRVSNILCINGNINVIKDKGYKINETKGTNIIFINILKILTV